MRPYPMIVCLLTAILLGGTFPAVGEEKPLPPPRHRVAAMYFHRTQRCPTCRRISAYIEEAIKTGFAEELPKRQVSLHLVDFQMPPAGRLGRERLKRTPIQFGLAKLQIRLADAQLRANPRGRRRPAVGQIDPKRIASHPGRYESPGS